MNGEVKQIALGQRIPDSPHAISVSLPTMRDVIAYEEKDPTTLAKLKSGYPRFVRHAMIDRFAAQCLEEFAKNAETQALFFNSEHALRDALKQQGSPSDIQTEVFRDVPVILAQKGSHSEKLFASYLQHTGTGLSSRQAEHLLHPDLPLESYDPEKLESQLWDWFSPNVASRIYTCKSGMNACYSAFDAANAFQSKCGRKDWMSVGWLYLDTLAILDNFIEAEAKSTRFENVNDTDRILNFIETHGHTIAGLFLEAPTNPLVQTPAISKISEACRRAGILTIMDPSLASPRIVDLSPWADIVCCSLTKYSGYKGNLMIGGICVNMETAAGPELADLVSSRLTPAFSGDLKCLSDSLELAPDITQTIQKNTMELVDFFQSCTHVDEVFWAYHPEHRGAYEQIQREENSPGGVVSMLLNKPIEDIYDRIPLPKGPSFGTEFSLVTPYVHLAHYDLLQSQSGLEQLKSAGLSANMIRVSVGTESISELKDAFAILNT